MVDRRGLAASYPFVVPTPEDYQPRNEERFRAQMAQANAEINDRLANAEQAVSALQGATPVVPDGFPAGGIIMWSGALAAIPAGWALCDGANGTPNLIDRFIVGAGAAYAVGATGGVASVALAEANMPAHSHSAGTLAAASGGSHTHTINDPGHIHSFTEEEIVNTPNTTLASGTLSRPADRVRNTASATTDITINAGGAHTHTVSGDTGSKGSGTEHENRPPYFALAYIMKL